MRSYSTNLDRKQGVRAEDFFDHRVGDRVQTVDGYPGVVVAVLAGPLAGYEAYEVRLDHGVGGGQYRSGDVWAAPPVQAALATPATDPPDLDPVEAGVEHDASADYPELGSILADRPPIENLKVYAAFAAADETDDPDDSAPEQDAEQPEQEQDKPDTCSYCGCPDFDEFTDTGRGTRARCAQCDATMVKPYEGIQWSPEFPNSSQNSPSRQSDSRSVINDPRSVHSALEVTAGSWWGDEPEDDVDPDQQDAMKAWACPHCGMRNQEWASECRNCGRCSHCGQQLPEGNTPQETYQLREPHRRMHMHSQLRPNLGGTDETRHNIAALNVAATAEAGYPIFAGLAVPPPPEPHFEFCATWREVQAKGVRLRKEGRVRVLAATGEGALGEVDGDNALYETEYRYVPGTRKFAYWHCGCKWSAWANTERTRTYKRFQNRPCSHNLALRFEVQARGMFGRGLAPDTERLPGQYQHTPVQVEYQRPTERAPGKDIRRRTTPPGNMRSEWTPKSRVRVKGSYDDSASDTARLGRARRGRAWLGLAGLAGLDGTEITPAHEWAREACASGISPSEVLTALQEAGMTHQGARQVLTYGTASWDACGVLADGAQALLVDVDPQTRLATLYDGRQVDVALVKYATHPFGEDEDEDDEEEDGLGREASYDTRSFMGGDPAQNYRSNTPHQPSGNPTSTGFATSADPPNWQLNIANPSNLTNWNAALHSASDATQGGGNGDPGGGDPSPAPGDDVTHAGVALKAADTGRVLMLQRSNHDESDPAAGTWEFPGGKLEDGDQTSLHGGIREWEEEIGQPFPSGGHLSHVHRSKNYLLHTVVIPNESAVDFSDGRANTNPDDPDGDDHEQSAWWEIPHAQHNPALRREVTKTPWDEIKKAAALDSDREKLLDPAWKTGYTHALDNQPYQLPDYEPGFSGYQQANHYAQGYQEGRADQGQKWGAREDFRPHLHGRWDAGYYHGLGGKNEIHDRLLEDQLVYGLRPKDPARAYLDGHQHAQHDRAGFDVHPEADWLLGQGEQGPSKYSTLHDEPEPALPSTDGASEEPDDPDEPADADRAPVPDATGPQLNRDEPWGFPQGTAQGVPQDVDTAPTDPGEVEPDPGPDDPLLSTPVRTPVVAGAAPASLLAQFWATAGGAALRHDEPAPHEPAAAGDFSNTQIAAAAQAVLAKTGAKDFSFAEQRELIEEGLVARARARNFSDLDIEGTHYALLSEADDEDLWL